MSEYSHLQSHVDLVLPLLHCYMDVTWVVLFGVTQSVTFALLLEALARSVRAAKPAVFHIALWFQGSTVPCNSQLPLPHRIPLSD